MSPPIPPPEPAVEDNLYYRIGLVQSGLNDQRGRQDRHEARFEVYVAENARRQEAMDGKLDQILAQQNESAALRRENEVRQDRRAKRIAAWAAVVASLIAGLLSAAFGEIVRLGMEGRL